MAQMSLAHVCHYLYPGQLDADNIRFGRDGESIPFITKWTVPDVEQPTIQYLYDQIPSLQNQFDLDYFQSVGNPKLMNYLDQVAQQRQYASAVGCASYSSSTVVQWRTEAETYIAWRDAVFSYVIAQFQLMQQGQRSVPEFEEFQAELPVIVWPA